MRLIDADVLKRHEQKIATQAWKMKIKASVDTILNQFIDDIDHAPTVDAVPVRHGRWEKCLGKELSCKCSVCASKYDIPWRYCPNCGTRMDWKDGNNEKAD